MKIELFCEDDIPEQQRFIKIASYSPLQGILDYAYIKDPMTQVYNINDINIIFIDRKD